MPEVRRLNALPRMDILGTGVTVSTFEEAVAALEGCVTRREPAVFSAANVYSVMLATEDPELREHVNRAAYVMADGMPLVWLARVRGFAAERVHGDDLLLVCSDRHRDWRHFFLGGACGQPAAVAQALGEQYPGLTVVGTRATPNRPVPPPENAQALAAIAEARPDVVWIGMGTPAQDHWMEANREAVSCPLVGVGSAFDLLSGRTRPTPGCVRRAGLQWLHRLVQEPRRLGARYLVYNARFIVSMARNIPSSRRRHEERDPRKR